MEKALPCNWPKRRPSSQKVGVDTAMLEEACPRKLRLKQKTERVSKLYVKTGIQGVKGVDFLPKSGKKYTVPEKVERIQSVNVPMCTDV